MQYRRGNMRCLGFNVFHDVLGNYRCWVVFFFLRVYFSRISFALLCVSSSWVAFFKLFTVDRMRCADACIASMDFLDFGQGLHGNGISLLVCNVGHAGIGSHCGAIRALSSGSQTGRVRGRGANMKRISLAVPPPSFESAWSSV